MAIRKASIHQSDDYSWYVPYTMDLNWFFFIYISIILDTKCEAECYSKFHEYHRNMLNSQTIAIDSRYYIDGFFFAF